MIKNFKPVQFPQCGANKEKNSDQIPFASGAPYNNSTPHENPSAVHWLTEVFAHCWLVCLFNPRVQRHRRLSETLPGKSRKWSDNSSDEVTGNEQRWREKNGRGRVLQWRRVGEGTSSQMLKLNRFLYHVDCHRDKEQQLNTEQVTSHWGAQPLVCGVVVGGTWKFVVLPPLSNKFATLASLVWVPAPPSPPTKSGWLTWGFIPLIPLWNPVNPLVI